MSNSLVGLLGGGLSHGHFDAIEKHLASSNIPYRILESHTQLDGTFRMAYSFGYPRIVPLDTIQSLENGLVVFHSSDLPKGRGWAPIFYTIYNELPEFCVSMFYADAGVDSGNLIAKGRYPMQPKYTSTNLRNLDDLIVLRLFTTLARRLYDKRYEGRPQSGEPTYYPKRSPEDSRIDANTPLQERERLMKAVSSQYPVYLEDSGGKKVFLHPEEGAKASFKIEDIKFEVYL